MASHTEPNDHKLNINLEIHTQYSLKNVLFKWIIQIGKVMIVLTELVALGALGYRFYIDRQIVDLHDEIKRQELLVGSLQKQETEYRGLQERLFYIDTLEKESKAQVATLQEILQIMNTGGFSTTNLSVSKNTIAISGTVATIFSLDSLIDSLKNNDDVTSISIDEISSSAQGVRFKMTIRLDKSVELPV